LHISGIKEGERVGEKNKNRSGVIDLKEKIMAKNKTGLSKEFKILAGIILLLAAFIGIGKVVTVILVLLGVYLLYEGLRKRN